MSYWSCQASLGFCSCLDTLHIRSHCWHLFVSLLLQCLPCFSHLRPIIIYCPSTVHISTGLSTAHLTMARLSSVTHNTGLTQTSYLSWVSWYNTQNPFATVWQYSDNNHYANHLGPRPAVRQLSKRLVLGPRYRMRDNLQSLRYQSSLTKD